MKVISCFVLTFFFGLNSFALTSKERSVLKRQTRKKILKIKEKDLIQELRSFVGCCNPNRFLGNGGSKKAFSYLIQRIKEIDNEEKGHVIVQQFRPHVDKAIQMYKYDFEKNVIPHFGPGTKEYKKWEKITDQNIKILKKLKNDQASNLIWEKKGEKNPNRIMVIGANFDNIVLDQKTYSVLEHKESQGADDNGTGVAIGLKIIEVLKDLKLPMTVKVVFFDYQELGFLGSWAYALDLKKELDEDKNKEFLGFIDLIMLGHDSKAKDKNKKKKNFKIYISKKGSKTHEAEEALASRLVQYGKKAPSNNMKFAIEANNFPYSDNVSFWEQGLPSVVFSQNWEDDLNYRNHSENDFVETLNFQTYYQSFSYISFAIISYLIHLEE